MVKYRRLSKEELLELEKEFVDFLCSNTITADDWVKLKKQDQEKAEELIDIFSDVVMEKVLSKITYLEHRSAQSLLLFKCLEKEIHLISLTINNTAIDLTKAEDVKLLAEGELQAKDVNVTRVTKAYQESREREVFEMTNSNCLVSDGSLYYLLDQSFHD